MKSKLHLADPRIYDYEELEKLPASDRQLLYSFASFVPRIARFPHCIMRNQSWELEQVLRIVDSRTGIWGNAEPWYDVTGEPFTPPYDGELTEHFQLWELPENQDQVNRYAGRDNVPFTMLISARTSKEVLHKLYQCDVEYSDYDFFLDRLTDFIEELRWAYLPLEYEGKFSFFVTASHLSMLTEQVRDALHEAGRHAFSLTHRGKRWYWEGPTQWDKTESKY